MPIMVGIAAALWLLLVLAVIAAVFVETLVLSMIRNILNRFRHGPADSAWVSALPGTGDQRSTIDDLDEVEDWLPGGWSHTSPGDATAWWSTGGPAPETMVIDEEHTSGATAVAEKRATHHTAVINQIWTIHPDHTAHWQDEARDCPWCRNERV